MANPRIEIDIVAVVDGLKKEFGQAVGIIGKLEEKALDLDKALKNATTLPEIANLNSKLAQTKAALTQLKTTGIEPLTKATSNYNAVGIDFARVIQDAPFGIIGVGNNIQQLAQSFSSLGKAGDSTGTRLKLAIGQIFSSGNLLILGVSALTTVLTILSQKGFFKTEESAKSLTDRLEDYRETLDAVTRSSIQGQANAAKEIQSFSLLRAQAENTNVSLENRLEAVKQLQSQYPEYLKGLSQEQILTGQVGNAYNELTKGLIATAKARAASDQIAKNSLDNLTLLAQEEERAQKILEARDKLESIRGNREKSTGQDLLALKTQESNQQRIVNALVQEQIKSAEDRNKISQEDAKLTGQINGLLSQGAVFTKEKVAQTKALNEEKRKGLSLEEDSIRNVEFGNKLQEEAKKKLQSLLPELQNVKNKFADINIGGAPIFEIADIDDSALTGFVLRLADFNAQVSEVIENGAQQTIGDFAFAIGDAIGSGGNVLKAGGAALLGGIAGILNQLGQLAIGAGLAVEGIKKALQTLNPAVAIGAGVALVALAGFVSSKAKSLGGGVRGGGGGGSSVGGSGVGGGSSFVGGAQGGMFASNRDLNGELVVRGQDLVYVFGQASDRINKG